MISNVLSIPYSTPIISNFSTHSNIVSSNSLINLSANLWTPPLPNSAINSRTKCSVFPPTNSWTNSWTSSSSNSCGKIGDWKFSKGNGMAGVRCASGNGGVLKSKGPVIVDIPLAEIRRPLLRTRTNDPQKVKELMESIAEIGLQEPIDVLEVEGVFYGFSGCHRYEAHQRLGLATIRCKVRRGTRETLRHHLR